MMPTNLSQWKDVMNRYFKHVLHNSSLYPLGTFWLGCMFVVPATMLGWMNHGHAVVILTMLAGFLLLVTDRRDMHDAATRMEHKVDEVTDLVNQRSDTTDASMHAQDIQLAHLTEDKDT